MGTRPNEFDPIDLETKTDRELLLLTAQRVNTLCNHVAIQNGRVAHLECALTSCKAEETKWRWRLIVAVTAGIAAGLLGQDFLPGIVSSLVH